MTGGRAVIIGKTGRNFGAGMSGGIAFVLDEDGTFASHCNMEMVGIEALEEHEDLDLVQGLLERHLEYTGSTVAERILRDWPAVATKFVKVMPLEYRRVLNEASLKSGADESREAAGVAGG
jgi:glutamate synthase domain-containing protein 3